VHLLESTALQRRRLNSAYLHRLTDDNLLRPYRFQAGLWSWSGTAGTTVGATVADGPDTWHWGWEAPTSQLRGHILGHWLSAAAHLRHEDRVLAARSDDMIDALEACQLANGDGWIAPFGPEHLERIVRREPAWAPHYVLHKVLAGLLDQAVLAGQGVALRILSRAADGYLRLTDRLDRVQLDDVLDYETGGMLEVWAGLLALTGEDRYRTLIARYRRGRFFDALLAGEDVLTDKHANTQIPEILGCARAFDATGDEQWLRIVEAFWEQAVTRRGTYVTGGSSSAEIWQPLQDQSARTHDVQEHCGVLNMMRLADWLHRRTGDVAFADYWEKNLVNGIFAQQNAHTGMVSYFLPLDAGSTKTWGRELQDFWCCHGSLLQAHTPQLGSSVHRHGTALRISQWIPCEVEDQGVHLRVTQDPVGGLAPGLRHPRAGTQAIQKVHEIRATGKRPLEYRYRVDVLAAEGGPEGGTSAVDLELRVPGWAVSSEITVDTEPTASPTGQAVPEDRIVAVSVPAGSVVAVVFEAALRAEPLLGYPSRIAFVAGPLVLAGLCEDERVLEGPADDPSALLRPDHERTHSWWNAGHYRTRDLDHGFRFVPLQEVTDESYGVYFPVRDQPR
jgi:DUF1680 family protein